MCPSSSFFPDCLRVSNSGYIPGLPAVQDDTFSFCKDIISCTGFLSIVDNSAVGYHLPSLWAMFLAVTLVGYNKVASVGSFIKWWKSNIEIPSWITLLSYLLYDVLREVFGSYRFYSLVANLVVCSSKSYCLSRSLLDHLILLSISRGLSLLMAIFEK